MDPIMDVIKNSEEPEWLEKPVIGELRAWQIVFLSLAGLTAVIVMICCCFRFRIPRTKQQIEADHQRRVIAAKFRAQLETIQDSKLDAMSLRDALELLHEKSRIMEDKPNDSQPSSTVSPVQTVSAAAEAGGQRPEPQVGGLNFVKFATKVAHLSRAAAPSPSEPAPSSPAPSTNNNMDF